MMQKKLCMIGVFGVGKTSLVKQYVHSLFSVKYHSTVGVKIDRKTVEVDGSAVTLVLWDIAGKDADEDIPPSYIRGAHAVMCVVDLTRRETWDELPALTGLVERTVGAVPTIVAFNKADIPEQWAADGDEVQRLLLRWNGVLTSAKTGQGVDDVFQWVARAVLTRPDGGP